MKQEWCGSHPEFRYRRLRVCVWYQGIQHVAKQNRAGVWAFGAQKLMDLSDWPIFVIGPCRIKERGKLFIWCFRPRYASRMVYAKTKSLLSSRKINLKMHSFMHPFERKMSGFLQEPKFFHICFTCLSMWTKYWVHLKLCGSAAHIASLSFLALRLPKVPAMMPVAGFAKGFPTEWHRMPQKEHFLVAALVAILSSR